MNAKNEKLTLLQALLIYLVAMHTPAMRFDSANATSTAHQAAWLSFIASLVVFVPFVFILFKVIKKFEGKSLHDIFTSIFGKAIGNVFSALYLLWLFILLGLYIKYSGGNLVTTVFVGTDENLLMFILVVIIGVMLRWGIATISRMNKIIFVLVVVQFVVTLLFLFLHFRADYVTPISTLDIGPVFESVIYPITIFVYITPLFIFNDQIMLGKKNFGKFSFAITYTVVKNTLMMLSLIGMLGYQLISKLRLPFFSAVENIALFNSSAGIDSLFMSIWMFAEFITVTFFTYCIIRQLKNMFKLKSDTPLLTPVLGLGLFFGMYYSSDIFQLTLFSKYITPALNISLGLGVPVLLFIVGKIRKIV